MEKLLVTGGAGYIGSHTVVELHRSGYVPIIVDNLCNSSKENLYGIEKILGKKIEFYKLDCTNKKDMKKVFEQERNISGIIHFAAFKSVEDSVKNPEKYYTNNIKSLETLLELMSEYKINNIIFSSSCTVYGEPDSIPVTEKTPFKKATSPYGETKQICEDILSKENCNSVSLRYFNPIGSHNSTLIGDCSNDEPTNLIPIITEVAIGKRKKITVFGNNYNTPDGTCIRDYIHVVDLAESHVKAIQFLLKNTGKYAFNIGTGKGVSVLKAIKIFEQETNNKIDYKIGPRRSGDIVQIYSDNSLALKSLNWKPKKSLENAMIDAWNWERRK